MLQGVGLKRVIFALYSSYDSVFARASSAELLALLYSASNADNLRITASSDILEENKSGSAGSIPGNYLEILAQTWVRTDCISSGFSLSLDIEALSQMRMFVKP